MTVPGAARLGVALARLEALAGTRRGALLLFAGSLAVYGLESLAVPLWEGRDLGNYLLYYDQFFHGVALPMSMLFRTPVAPLVVGPALDFLGGAGSQVLMGLLFAASVVAWAAAAATFGRRPALLTGAALALFPSYGFLFHRISTDQVFAAGFAAWALLFARTARRPTVARHAALGLGVGLLALTRPGNQVLLALALFPLTLALPWRRRLAAAGAFAATGLAVLGLWALHNGLRYGDYTVARGDAAFLPFFRMFMTDHIVSPDNGPASRELARAVQRDLLVEEPYRSYGVTVQQFFARGDARMHEDLVNLSDRVWGWDSDYAKLRAAALEALRRHPVTYAEGVLNTLDLELRGVEVYLRKFEPQPGGAAASSPGAGPTVTVRGRRLPAPSEGSLIPAAHMGLFSTTPDGSVREVWTSPTEHHFAFSSPERRRRFEQASREANRLGAKLPTYRPIDACRRAFNLLSRLYPRSVLWLAVGLVAVAIRRPRGSRVALALALGAALVILVTALAIFAVLEFALPVLPAFVLLAAVGLVGERGAGRSPAAPATAGG